MEHTRRTIMVGLAVALLAAIPEAGANERTATLLLFMQPDDVRDTVGHLSYDDNVLGFRGNIQGTDLRTGGFQMIFSAPEANEGTSPPFRTLLATAEARGGYLVYGTKHEQQGRNYRWAVFRGRTPAGHTLPDWTQVYACPPGEWLIESMITHRPDADRLFFYTWSRSDRKDVEGHALRGFTSADGTHWQPISAEPIYYDHDAFGVMWDARTNRFLAYQGTDEPWKKTYPDNMGGERRRVLSIRASRDGLHWETLKDVGRDGRITPDAQDPPEVEFYRMFAFPFADRYVAMVDLYAPSPLTPGKHGPHLGCQWWVSHDAVHWQRPWRRTDAQGDAPYPIKMAPMHFGREMLWWIANGVWGLPENRIASVGAKANAAFTSKPFRMPGRPLQLNATIPSGSGLFQQAYVMVELLDAAGKTVPGYEREKCLLRGVDDTRIPLLWENRDGTELAGRELSLRFYFRAARLYAVSHETHGTERGAVSSPR